MIYILEENIWEDNCGNKNIFFIALIFLRITCVRIDTFRFLYTLRYPIQSHFTANFSLNFDRYLFIASIVSNSRKNLVILFLQRDIKGERGRGTENKGKCTPIQMHLNL